MKTSHKKSLCSSFEFQSLFLPKHPFKNICNKCLGGVLRVGAAAKELWIGQT
jgi:hypothetical protein